MSARQRMLKDRKRRVENKKRINELPWTQAEESVRTRGGRINNKPSRF